MIQMQRSSSLPGPGHASPPVSPTITHVSSRSPTPSPPENDGLPRLHRYQSRSPQRPITSYKELPNDRDGRWTTGQDSSRSPSPSPTSAQDTPGVVDRSSTPKPHNQQSIAPMKMPQPLLQDVSQYMNTQISAITAMTANTSLEELAHLVRLSTYQEKKRVHSRIRLQRSLVSTALSARLARCGELAHRTLVDNFRADEKKNFANLYNAIHDVRNSCDASRRFALLEPDFDNGRSSISATEDTGLMLNFMHEIPLRSRECLLNFLTQIRTNSDYLASRIASLTPTELSALTSFHQGLEAVDSVLPFHTRSKGHTASAHRNFSHIPSAVERLLSFQRHDPLSALIHTCFANSAGPDSLEDLRRTDVWATACARLITESKSGTDPFICSVLNVWTTMRDWSGRGNMEWYLMKILEDGAFLLEKAEDQAGTRIHVEPRNAKDSIAADEFYDAAIHGLFGIIDDPGAGGIPEGLIELGNAILRKLDPKRHGPTRRFLVSKWLFSVFLLNAIIHPESYGMMSEYHITEYGRQKILKEVAMRAQRLVVDMTWNKSSPPPAIKAHIENILARFRSARPSKSIAKLLPARSITSLRETAEVHPYLVLAPADLLTMANALFPERRPASSFSMKDSHLSGLRSAASSVSGMSAISVLIPQPPIRESLDSASIMSNSGSSTISDVTTSREPLLNETSIIQQRASSISVSSNRQNQRLSYYEDDGFELREALQEMSRALGSNTTSGACHPCAERWTVLFMTPDGQGLSTQMLHDDDEDDEEATSSSDTDEDNNGVRSDLDKDYHQLRSSILKLVEDYEIPESLDSRSESKTFSNRTSILETPRRKYHSKPKSLAQIQSRNPYRTRDQSPRTDKPSRGTDTKHARQRAETETELPSVLISMLEAAESQCKAQSDFINAHLYWKTLRQLNQMSSASLKKDGFASLLTILSRGPRDCIRRSTSAIEEYDAWLVWLKQSQERHDTTIESMMKRLKALRDKMWYVTDVRNSAAYEGTRNIAIALKCMVSPKKGSHLDKSNTRSRNIAKPVANNFLLKTEAQVMDMMAANEDQGGPNKLSDEQAEKTLRWLSQFGIENFCKGEERIHRFSLEIETCINKLVGDNLMEGPVLWSSELYNRDKRILDSGKQKGDLSFNSFGSLNLSGEDLTDTDSTRRGLRSTDFNRPGFHDLRAMSTRNNSQQSFSSGRFSTLRINPPGDLMDSQDYFGMASPVLTIDSATTFWSPLQTRAQSPTTSVSSHRPDTASSTNETIMLKDDHINAAKQRFLTDLKQTLTSLLLSDLGTLVFARGSETDSWFSGSIGQDCIERKDRADRRARRKSRKRVIEKKKSFGDLRGAQKIEQLPMERQDSHGENAEKGCTSSNKSLPDTGASENRSTTGSSSTSDSVSTRPRKGTIRAAKESDNLEFPYRMAFQRLLRMFSVHPNPYAKLNALYELEHLIVAYLTPSTTRRPRVRQEPAPTSPQSPEISHHNAFGPTDATTTTPMAKTLGEAIDNCKERRSHALNQGDNPSPANRNTERYPSSNVPTAASTDMIVEVLQDLFRDADMRPKTLFRDLQFIASFIPAATLDKTERGKAFWDAGLAALGLKQDVCRTLIEIADEIVVHYTQTRKTTTMVPDSSSLNGELMKYSMQDAANMWSITAKEGDPVAERELAIFYLTHPELVERITAPLSKPRETFKAQVMEMHQGKEGVVTERDRERSDPATMCVAYHWMELSALGGDELAKKYLRQREELNAIP
ncbi:7ac4e7ce-d972-4d37-892a-d0304c7e7612 [Sclerotinia trifoliorum]|uniref:7ac4e7ce-d972-4d37-892a-d0304c7e7612 n=1 Tax=Sclerotinia trifoliorum TaxID=28548 RepID=A0A8H2ZVN5_9HELO|nr:7ac4e7ce-d972-4d37-892a-d0304c7e7612 [Sclerotinia trifoliorum]